MAAKKPSLATPRKWLRTKVSFKETHDLFYPLFSEIWDNSRLTEIFFYYRLFFQGEIGKDVDIERLRYNILSKGKLLLSLSISLAGLKILKLGQV